MARQRRDSPVRAAEEMAASVEVAAGGDRQELVEVVVEDELIQDAGRGGQPPTIDRWIGPQSGELFVADGRVQVGRDGAAIVQAGAGRPPLPQLGSADLGRRRVL